MVAQTVSLHKDLCSPGKWLWPVQPDKLMNNTVHPFVLPLKYPEMMLWDKTGCWFLILPLAALQWAQQRTRYLFAFPAFQMHASYFYWYAKSKCHAWRSSQRCHEETLMPPVWELNYLKCVLPPGSFSVKRSTQVTAIVGALRVYGGTGAVGEKDENLLPNVTMAADWEASGSVLHPFQCPRQ